MSCRHDLALTTCKVCYPKTGTIIPEGRGTSMEEPGALPLKPPVRKRDQTRWKKVGEGEDL
jgi:hypothetical protein